MRHKVGYYIKHLIGIEFFVKNCHYEDIIAEKSKLIESFNEYILELDSDDMVCFDELTDSLFLTYHKDLKYFDSQEMREILDDIYEKFPCTILYTWLEEDGSSGSIVWDYFEKNSSEPIKKTGLTQEEYIGNVKAHNLKRENEERERAEQLEKLLEETGFPPKDCQVDKAPPMQPSEKYTIDESKLRTKLEIKTKIDYLANKLKDINANIQDISVKFANTQRYFDDLRSQLNEFMDEEVKSKA